MLSDQHQLVSALLPTTLLLLVSLSTSSAALYQSLKYAIINRFDLAERSEATSVPKTIKHNKITGERAEPLAIEALQAAGFTVVDLNQFAKNFPLVDFIARRGTRRLLVQVRGTTTKARWFRLAYNQVEKFIGLADALDLHAIYAFVHIDGMWPEVRFGCATDVADAVVDGWIYGGGYDGVSMDYHRFVDANLVGAIDELLSEGA